MTQVEEAIATLEIQRVLALYCQLLDDLRLEAWGELFCEDATWTYEDVVFRGRAQIVEGLRGIEPSRPGLVRHITHAPVVVFEGESARSWADAIALTVGAEHSPVVFVGRYHDVLRREHGRWRFFSRLAVASGKALPEGVSAAPPW